MIELTLDLREVDRALTRLERQPTVAFMRALVDAELRQVDQRFDRKEDPEGRPWKPWSAAYRKRGAPFHSRHTLLHLSGDMQGAVQAGQISDARASIEVPGIYYAARQNAERQFLGFVDNDPVLRAAAVDFLIREVSP